ncbi:MAG: TIGR04149 family rSAM-modified RiPP [Tannerellaceae bacterium]|nr:TIGR04149 family rSAM-modified RiPP [Tannerellaceae bacterium]
MKKLKKISLKKEVVDRLNSNQMNHLKGGAVNMLCGSGGGSGSGGSSYGGSYYSGGNTSDVSCPNTCGASWTCNG